MPDNRSASAAPPAKLLSPRRKTTAARDIEEGLAREQLAHFHIDANSPVGAPLLRLTQKLYSAHEDLSALWSATTRELAELPRSNRVALFNAKKFVAFQLAKLLDQLQNPTRAVHQSLGYSTATMLAKGPYPTFDNVAAIFSANPVITRTATYIFACTEWIDDAFQGREPLHEIYSRLLNPTSISLANHIVDIEAGARAREGAIESARTRYADRLNRSREIYLYLESPCNPHGTFLDVPAICRAAHAAGTTVMLDATVGTPFLVRPLQREDPAERPDFVIHSYTKDLVGDGNTTAGVVIGRNADMFLPKGEPGWEQTLFWNVYYIKGAFLDADKAYEVLSGMKTLELRMLKKCINTQILARWLSAHPHVRVHGPANPADPNAPICERLSYLGLASPLFTIDFETAKLDRATFQRFFDSLAPMFGHMVSLGQSNTVVLCPALTSHSELGPEALRAAGITPTTIRIAVGDEDPRELIASFLHTAKLAIDPTIPGFSGTFLTNSAVDDLVDQIYIETHCRHARNARRFDQVLK